jgi:hypothetical protein
MFFQIHHNFPRSHPIKTGMAQPEIPKNIGVADMNICAYSMLFAIQALNIHICFT